MRLMTSLGRVGGIAVVLVAVGCNNEGLPVIGGGNAGCSDGGGACGCGDGGPCSCGDGGACGCDDGGGCGCSGDRDCGGATPRCDSIGGKCVACLPAGDNCPPGQRCAQGA